MSLIKQVNKIQLEQNKSKNNVYTCICTKIENQIIASAKKGLNYCIYTVPMFILGYPIVNVPEAIDYILQKFEEDGFVPFKISENVVCITWSNDGLANGADRPSTDTGGGETEDDKFISSLVRYKKGRKP
jgi:hypothetical protein